MDDRLLRIGSGVLRLANVLNWIGVAAFVVALIASFPFADVVLARLTMKYHDQNVVPILNALRLMMLAALPLGVVLHVIFTRLRMIVDSVRAGDPFVAANAVRLTSIGWGLLAVQILDLMLGLIVGWFTVRGVDTAGWQPSFGGWLSVLMMFVLARVFTIGTRMRDELEMTV